MDNWIKASPWLNQSVNPRDLIMPTDGDDGFFPASANQFVSPHVFYLDLGSTSQNCLPSSLQNTS